MGPTTKKQNCQVRGRTLKGVSLGAQDLIIESLVGSSECLWWSLGWLLRLMMSSQGALGRLKGTLRAPNNTLRAPKGTQRALNNTLRAPKDIQNAPQEWPKSAQPIIPQLAHPLRDPN